MSGRIKNAFDEIRADENLKESTTAYINSQRMRREKKRSLPRFRMAFAAAAAALALMIGGGYSVYAIPESYISIDVNPSVELTLNRFDRVLSATAYNDDGLIVLDSLDLKNARYTDAIDTLVESAAFSAYLTDGNDLSIAVVSDDGDDLISGILSCRAIQRYGAYYTLADADTRQEAHACGMSFGKYQAYLDLSQYDGSITPETCRNMTMREMHTLLTQYQGSTGSTGYGYKRGWDDGTGSEEQNGACTGADPENCPDAGTGNSWQGGSGGKGSGYHGGN